MLKGDSQQAACVLVSRHTVCLTTSSGVDLDLGYLPAQMSDMFRMVEFNVRKDVAVTLVLSITGALCPNPDS